MWILGKTLLDGIRRFACLFVIILVGLLVFSKVKPHLVSLQQLENKLGKINTDISSVEEELEKARKELEAARKKASFVRKTLDFLNFFTDSEIEKLEKEIEDLEEQLSTLKLRQTAAEKDYEEAPGSEVFRQVKTYAPTAAVIAVSLLAFQWVGPAMLFWIVAPFVAKGPGIRFDQEPADNNELRYSQDGPDIHFSLRTDQVLWLRQGFLQVSDGAYSIKPRAILSWKMPFSCLAARLFLLHEIKLKERSADSDPPTITIGCQDESLDTSEFSRIHIPKGGAVVCHPHCIAGIIVDRSKEFSFVRRWILTNRQAWLTLQLGYFIFHGPSTLILFGRRGVKIETANDSGKLISQSATVGFTTDTTYMSRRSEAFLAYLRGVDDLFNDHFKGDHGAYFYEQVPSKGRDNGLKGLFKGVYDAILKLFGI